jgi:hypothetical protein
MSTRQKRRFCLPLISLTRWRPFPKADQAKYLIVNFAVKPERFAIVIEFEEKLTGMDRIVRIKEKRFSSLS